MKHSQLSLALLTAVLSTVICTSCGPADGEEPASGIGTRPSSANIPGDLLSRSDSGTRLLLEDGFEGGSLAEFWAPGDYGSGRYEPGAVAISSDFARSGRSSVRITVHKGDIDQPGDPGTRSERAELDSGKHALLDQQIRYRFSVLVPDDFPIVDNRLVIAQWKQDGVSGSPVVAQRFRGGHHYMTIRRIGGLSGERRYFQLPTLTTGAWHDMEYTIGFSTDDRGFVRVLMDGKEVVTYSGPTAFTQGTNRFYNKIGLYRDRWPTPMTIYFDNYELTTLSGSVRGNGMESSKWSEGVSWKNAQ